MYWDPSLQGNDILCMYKWMKFVALPINQRFPKLSTPLFHPPLPLSSTIPPTYLPVYSIHDYHDHPATHVLQHWSMSTVPMTLAVVNNHESEAPVEAVGM